MPWGNIRRAHTLNRILRVPVLKPSRPFRRFTPFRGLKLKNCSLETSSYSQDAPSKTR